MLRGSFAVAVYLTAFGLPACGSGSEEETTSAETATNESEDAGTAADDGDATDDDATDDETSSQEPEPSEDDSPGAGPIDEVDDDAPDIDIPMVSVPGSTGGMESDAGAEPEPSAAEPEPSAAEPVAEPEPSAPPEPVQEPAVEPEPVAAEPEPMAEPEPAPGEPEPVVEPVPPEPVPPEPAVIEPVVNPEPMVEPVVQPEPVPVEPEPDPCSDMAACNLACKPGSVHPVDQNGCVDSCSCEYVDEVCSTCGDDEECIVENSNDGTRYTCAGVVAGCASVLACGCFEDYGDCSTNEAGLCECTLPPNPCGSCSDGKRCIYQRFLNGSGSSGRYVCASVDDCQGPDDCSCIEQQGECTMDPDRGVCACGTDLIPL